MERDDDRLNWEISSKTLPSDEERLDHLHKLTNYLLFAELSNDTETEFFLHDKR